MYIYIYMYTYVILERRVRPTRPESLEGARSTCSVAESAPHQALKPRDLRASLRKRLDN